MIKVTILPIIKLPYRVSEIRPEDNPKNTTSAITAVTASATAIHVKTFTKGEVVLDDAYV
jgi:hypothetical protein